MGSCALASCNRETTPENPILNKPSFNGLKISINTGQLSQSTATNQVGTPLNLKKFLFNSSIKKPTPNAPLFNKITYHSVSDFDRCDEVICQDKYREIHNGLCIKTAQNVTIKQYKGLPEDVMDKIIKTFPELYELNHSNIIQVFRLYDYNTIPKGKFYIIYEHFSSSSLSETLKEFGSLNEKIIQFYTKKILNGLQFLHDKEIVHKNITPTNVFVIGNNIKISDGIIDGILIGDGREPYGNVINPYLSYYFTKEHPRLIDKSFDFWCLGCLIIELFTAANPWIGLSTKPVRAKPLISLSNIKITPPIPDKISDILKEFLNILFDPQKTNSKEIFDILLDSKFLNFEYPNEAVQEKKPNEDLGLELQVKQIKNLFNGNATYSISESESCSQFGKSNIILHSKEGSISHNGIRSSLSKLMDNGRAFKSTRDNYTSLINKNNVIHELPERNSDTLSDIRI